MPTLAPRLSVGLVVSGLFLCAVVVASFAIGAKNIPPADVLAALLGRGEGGDSEIVSGLRLSRTVLGLVCGVALGAAGVLMQALTRNPLADPGILGVNAGAALGVVTGLVVTGSMGVQTTVWWALLGAGLASAAVFMLAGSSMAAGSPARLTLAGVALAAVLAGVTQALVITDEAVLDAYRFWQVGSLTARSYEDVVSTFVFVAVAVVLALLLIGSLNALALGDETASALGVRPGVVRVLVLIAVALGSGVATALAGPIAFVGLVVPHMVRLLVGSDLRIVLPISLIASPAVLLLADVLGRVIGGGAEIPAGVVTAFVGAPALIFFVVTSKRRSLA